MNAPKARTSEGSGEPQGSYNLPALSLSGWRKRRGEEGVAMQENCTIVRSRWCHRQFCLFTDVGGRVIACSLALEQPSDALQSGLVCRLHRCAAVPLWSGGMLASAGMPEPVPPRLFGPVPLLIRAASPAGAPGPAVCLPVSEVSGSTCLDFICQLCKHLVPLTSFTADGAALHRAQQHRCFSGTLAVTA